MTVTAFEPGDIFLAYFPMTDQSSQKMLRPVLVVSRGVLNSGEDFVAVPISSRLRDDAFSVHVLDSEPWFGQTGLRMSSAIKWSKPMTLTKSVISKRLGKLPAPMMSAVAAKIRSLFPEADSASCGTVLPSSKPAPRS